MREVVKKTAYAGGLLVLSAQSVLAADTPIEKGAVDAKPAGVDGITLEDFFQKISNTLIFIVGAVAVLVIIYGGLLYVTSTGDAKRVESAKNTILYGVIGLVVAILAYALVRFVIRALT